MLENIEKRLEIMVITLVITHESSVRNSVAYMFNSGFQCIYSKVQHHYCYAIKNMPMIVCRSAFLDFYVLSHSGAMNKAVLGVWKIPRIGEIKKRNGSLRYFDPGFFHCPVKSRCSSFFSHFEKAQQHLPNSTKKLFEKDLTQTLVGILPAICLGLHSRLKEDESNLWGFHKWGYPQMFGL